LVRRLRLERAALQLNTSDMSILQISLAAGYESDMAFSRVFKAKTGLLPSVFRNTLKAHFPCSTTASIRYMTNERISSFEPLIEEELTMNVMIKQVEDIVVAFVRHTLPYQACGQAWDLLCSTLAPEGLLGGDAKMIGVSYDDPDVVDTNKLRYDACISVDDSFRPMEKIDLYKLHKTNYIQAKEPKLIQVSTGNYLTIDGSGAPGDTIFMMRLWRFMQWPIR
jgi:AraC family transcriptional regulator